MVILLSHYVISSNSYLRGADSDAVITKGMIALLLRVVDGQSPEDIADYEFKFLEEIGLTTHLSPSRANGLLSMVKQIRLYGVAFQGKET